MFIYCIQVEPGQRCPGFFMPWKGVIFEHKSKSDLIQGFLWRRYYPDTTWQVWSRWRQIFIQGRWTGWKKQKMPRKVSGSKWTQWKYHWNRNLYERSQRSLDENGNRSGTAVKGFKKSEYKIDFMAVPSINNTTWFVFETNTMEHHRNWCFIQRLQQPIVGIQLFSDNPLLNGKRKI